MIKLNGKIRLTAKELKEFQADTGSTRIPTTEVEFNQCLQDAADYWRQMDGDDPAANLLATLIELDKIGTEAGPVVSSHAPQPAGQAMGGPTR